MPVTYTSRRNKTYYLHQGTTKTGKPKYHFSMKDKGNLVDEIPDGYEIYEHPSNAQVFLRQTIPKLITDIEEYSIKKHLKKLDTSRPYRVDIRGKVITIFESDQDPDALKRHLGDFLNIGSLRMGITPESFLETIDSSSTQFNPILRFTLEDEKTRSFIAERFCFRGSIDDWIHIGGPNSLEKLAKRFIEHLGSESFFDFY